MSHHAWTDLIEGLEMLYQHKNDDVRPLHCEHDELWVMSDPTKYTPEELARLDELGFFVAEDGFKSHRFGSA